MDLHLIDWIVIFLYGALTVALGLWYSKRAGKNVEEYFVAGRTLPWWIAGTSIAATYFATDAPLLAAALVRQHGIYFNWLWWYEAAGVMMLVFFYAKLWRRANIITDAEFIELRYSGKPASILRVFTALYHGLLKNLVVMGFVLLAMMKFTSVILGFDPFYTLVITVSIALVYTVSSGLYGVVYTDMLQFITGIIGTSIFAGIVLYQLGGPAEMAAQISAIEGVNPGTLDIVPTAEHLSSLEFISFMVLIFILWSRSAQGDGYFVQRLFAAKNEKHSILVGTLVQLYCECCHDLAMDYCWVGLINYFTACHSHARIIGRPRIGLSDDDFGSSPHRI